MCIVIINVFEMSLSLSSSTISDGLCSDALKYEYKQTAVELPYLSGPIIIRTAAVVRGGRIVGGEEGDKTGMMTWGGGRLMALYCSVVSRESNLSHDQQQQQQQQQQPTLFDVLELGAGNGLVPSVVAKRMDGSCSQNDEFWSGVFKGGSTWYVTDGDEESVDLSFENVRANAARHRISGKSSDCKSSLSGEVGEEISIIGFKFQKLLWGRGARIMGLPFPPNRHFRRIVAADVIYPSSVGKVLSDLFDTVDDWLTDDGEFLTSYVERDCVTSCEIIDAATSSGFAIDEIDVTFLEGEDNNEAKMKFEEVKRMCCGAKLLRFRRTENGGAINNHLGSPSCHIFRDCRERKRRLEESSEEEYEFPFSRDSE